MQACCARMQVRCVPGHEHTVQGHAPAELRVARREPRDLSIPIWETEQLVICSVKMASQWPKERWDKFKSQPQFCREVSLFSVILETADSVAGAGA